MRESLHLSLLFLFLLVELSKCVIGGGKSSTPVKDDPAGRITATHHPKSRDDRISVGIDGETIMPPKIDRNEIVTVSVSYKWPSPLVSYSFNGTGCHRHWPIQIGMNNEEEFTIFYDSAFAVFHGVRVPMDYNIKKCDIRLTFKPRPGYQFSLNSVILRGHAELQSTSTAFQTMSFSHNKPPHLISTSKSIIASPIYGPAANDFIFFEDLIDLEESLHPLRQTFVISNRTWSPCVLGNETASESNGTTSLYFRNTVNISSKSKRGGGESERNDEDEDLEFLDFIGPSVLSEEPYSQQFQLLWRHCRGY